jgi:hypothetical protein
MTETGRRPVDWAVGQSEPMSGRAGWVIFAGVIYAFCVQDPSCGPNHFSDNSFMPGDAGE